MIVWDMDIAELEVVEQIFKRQGVSLPRKNVSHY